MRRQALIHELTAAGCYLARRGRKHNIYANPRNGRKAPIPRHAEIRDSLCELIRRQLGLR